MEITQKELKEIISEHESWLESEGNDGKIADFTSKNLENVNLRGLDLSEAIFKNTNLTGADLRSTDLSGAELKGSTLKNVKVDHFTKIDGSYLLSLINRNMIKF